MDANGVNPTQKDIDALTAFLPILYAEGLAPILEWKGGRQPDGTIHVPYPVYAPAVDEFFRLAGQECWCDYDYIPAEVGEFLKNDENIRNATLAELKSMLTYCVRGERFCDGHRGAMINEGYIRKILERLREVGGK